MKLYLDEILALLFAIAIVLLAVTAPTPYLRGADAFVAWGLFLYILLSIPVGRLAVRYLRSRLAWFVLALIFSPPTALVFLIVAGRPQSAVSRREK